MQADNRAVQLETVAKGRLLLVDDDALFRESLGQNLVDEGYEVENVDGGQAALDYLTKDATVDTVLLDWRMPGLDGLAVLRLMRERSHTMPVLFLTALTDNIYEEAALALGAVDFISKSRSLSVILQRLSLIMDGRKRPVPAGSEIIQRGKLELRPAIGRAFWDGHRIELTLTEFTILQTLAETPKRDFSYRDIYDIVRGRGFVAGWGEEGYRVNVRSFIKRIRQKFRAIDDTFDSIKNYSGYGYYWDHGE
jgi:two-component system, OmpR family, response regulator ChvI